MHISADKQDNDMEKYFFRASAQDFNKVPNIPIAYWMIKHLVSAYYDGGKFSDYAHSMQGMITGNNNKFLRLWYEPSKDALSIKKNSIEEVNKVDAYWIPYNKGGDLKKWYGNNEFVLNWKSGGKDLTRARTQNSKYYFQPCITWTFISSSFFAARYCEKGFVWDVAGSSAFPYDKSDTGVLLTFLCSLVGSYILKGINPTLNYQVENILSLPVKKEVFYFKDALNNNFNLLVSIAKVNWDSYETSWDFTTLPLLHSDYGHKLQGSYEQLRTQWQENTLEMQRLEEENNRIFIEAYGLEDELTPDVPLNEITLICNPHYRYRLGKQWDDANEAERNAELERQLQSDTICELISYIIGCMMGRYSIDQPGLILASQGERLQDYLQRVPSPRFMPDDDAIVPLTDQEWFEDDATHRVREFVRTIWGEQHLQENLDFIAESLCLSAMRPRKGESSLDCIRRYLSTQFYKDHMRTYKKRPIYWLFSSGKLKAFECLVYLHRYNEGTLARMRTEYVIPLTARLHSHGERLEEARANSTSAAETKRLEKELDQLHKQQAELAEFDEQLRHYADQRIRLDLDDGVKVNYGKFGNLLADVKTIAG